MNHRMSCRAPRFRLAGSVERLECRLLLSAEYTIVDLGELPDSIDNGSNGAFATGVNDSGQVCGQTLHNFGGQSAAFFWSEAQGMQELDPVILPGQHEYNVVSSASGISNDGICVGVSNGLPVEWNGPTSTQLQLPQGFTSGEAAAISGDSNYSAGNTQMTGVPIVGTVWSPEGAANVPGDFDITGINSNGGECGNTQPSDTIGEATFNGTPIGFLPNDDSSTANGINDNDFIVGSSLSSGTNQITEAFIYDAFNKTPMQPLGFLDHGTQSVAYGINSSNQVVGDSDTFPGGTDDAFIWTQKSGMQDLNDLIAPDEGWHLEQATAISDNGYIVGYGTNPQGQNQSFILTPTTFTPPPGSGSVSANITSTTLPSTFVPGESGQLALSLKNTGGSVKGKLTAQAYLSPDGQLADATPLTAKGASQFSISLKAGQSSKLNVGFIVPADVATGSQQLLVALSSSGAVASSLPTSPVVDSNVMRAELGFGTVGGRARTQLVESIAGAKTTFMLNGPGAGTLTADGSGGFALALSGTSPASAVVVKSTSAISVDSVSVDSPLGLLNAPTLSISGNSNLAGGVKNAKLGDISDASLSLGGSLSTSLTLAAVADSSIISSSPLANLTVSAWTTTGVSTSIAAPAIGKFVDKGNFNGTLSASGNVASVLIGGNLAGDVLAGTNLGANNEPGGGDDTFAAGSIHSLRVLGDVTTSLIAAGLDEAGDVFPVDGTETLIAGSKISSVSIDGNLSADSKILSAVLPKTVAVDHSAVATATDPRFNP